MVVLGVVVVSYELGTPVRRSRPDSGLGLSPFSQNVFKTFEPSPSSLGNGLKIEDTHL